MQYQWELWLTVGWVLVVHHSSLIIQLECCELYDEPWWRGKNDTSTLKNDCSMAMTFVEALHVFHRAVLWEARDKNSTDTFITWKHFGHTGLSISFNPDIGFFILVGGGNWLCFWWMGSWRHVTVVILRISYPHTTSEKVSDDATTWEKMVAFAFAEMSCNFKRRLFHGHLYYVTSWALSSITVDQVGEGRP